MQVDPTEKTQLELRNGHLLPLNSWPVDQPSTKTWAAPLVGYDEDLQYNWDISGWLDQVERDGDEYYDISELTVGNLIRVNTTGRPAIFGVTDITDAYIEVVPVEEDDAIIVLSDESPASDGDTTTDTVTSDETTNGTSTQATLADAPDQLDVSTATGDSDDPATSTNGADTTSDTDASTTGSTASPRSGGSNVARKNRRLPSDAEIGDLSLRSVMEDPVDENGEPIEDYGDLPILGFQVVYTTGSSLLVPRDELLAKMDELGIPEWMAPYKVKPHDAYTRIFDREFISGLDRLDKVNGYFVTYGVTENGDDKYDRTLDVRKHIPEEECGIEGGRKEHIEIARIQYDKETQDLDMTLKDDAKGTEFERVWEAHFEPHLNHLFALYQTHHKGDDLTGKTLKYLVNHWTDAIRIRDACYFIPAVYDDLQDLLAAFTELYEWLDEEHKTSGQKTSFYYFEINNNDQQREIIHDRVINELEDSVDSLFDDIYEAMADDDFAEEVVEEILDERKDEMETVADRYSEIVEGRLSVKQLIREQLSNLEDEKQNLVEEALAEHGTVTPTELRG